MITYNQKALIPCHGLHPKCLKWGDLDGYLSAKLEISKRPSFGTIQYKIYWDVIGSSFCVVII